MTGLGDPGAVIAPIARTTLHGELVERIRTMIIEGHLPPGSRVHEGQLGETLGISRTPLREALKFLASEGLIELVPGKGAVVRLFSPRDVQDMLEVLGALEALAGRRLCREGSDGQISILDDMHVQMIERYESGERRDYYRLNQAIHTGIVEGAGNRLLATQHAAIQARLKRIRFVAHEGRDHWRDAVAEHERINAALVRRNGSALANALTEHLEATWLRVHQTL